MQIHFMVFALSRQINKQKHAKTINPLCAGNKVFVKYQAQGEFSTPTLRTPLKVTNVVRVVVFNTQNSLARGR